MSTPRIFAFLISLLDAFLIFDFELIKRPDPALLVLLEELMGANVVAQEAIQTDAQLTPIFNKCSNFTTTKLVPVASTIQEAFAKF